jgi:choline dehydrogenase
MSMAPSQLGAFTRSSERYAWPNVQYHVQPLSLEAFGEPLHLPTPSPPASATSTLARASDHLGRPGGRPSILANYLSTEEDRQVAADSLRLTRRIAAMPALAPYRPREVKPGVQYQSDEDLARLAGDIGTTIFHPVGTCKMGRRTTRWRWWTAACACAACGACGWLTPA